MSTTTWEHLVIERETGEQRFLCRGRWAGDTYYYFDAAGNVYERRPPIAGQPETFEEIAAGDRWTLCDGYHLNTISGETSIQGGR